MKTPELQYRVPEEVGKEKLVGPYEASTDRNCLMCYEAIFFCKSGNK